MHTYVAPNGTVFIYNADGSGEAIIRYLRQDQQRIEEISVPAADLVPMFDALNLVETLAMVEVLADAIRKRSGSVYHAPPPRDAGYRCTFDPNGVLCECAAIKIDLHGCAYYRKVDDNAGV